MHRKRARSCCPAAGRASLVPLLEAASLGSSVGSLCLWEPLCEKASSRVCCVCAMSRPTGGGPG
eukprot:2332063-Amphidinium_carterae.1